MACAMRKKQGYLYVCRSKRLARGSVVYWGDGYHALSFN